MHTTDTWVEVSRGDLSPELLELLDLSLVHHGLAKSSPYSTPETLAFVCLKCGSVGESSTRGDRDTLVENFDLRCCGLTVTFHSTHRVLTEPASLGAPVRVRTFDEARCDCGTPAGYHTTDCEGHG